MDGSKSIKGQPTKLQQTKLNIINDTRCSKVFLYDKTKMYCTIDKNKSSNVCFGDSGGPLMVLSNGRWHLYGITSMVILNGTIFNRFCNPNEPSYFTSVPSYLDFVAYAIEKLIK
jgi:hypothetical protein